MKQHGPAQARGPGSGRRAKTVRRLNRATTSSQASTSTATPQRHGHHAEIGAGTGLSAHRSVRKKQASESQERNGVCV